MGYKTLVRIKESVRAIVPMWVTMTFRPLGRLKCVRDSWVKEVEYEVEFFIWSVAPVSKIQGTWFEGGLDKHVENEKRLKLWGENTEWDRSTVILAAMWEVVLLSLSLGEVELIKETSC